MSDNNIEAAVPMNIGNSYKTQIFNSHFKSVWKITKISTEKNRLWLNSGIIHSEKQPSNNVTSNETAQLTSVHILILFTQCQTWKMKLPFKKMVLRTWEKALPLHVSVENQYVIRWNCPNFVSFSQKNVATKAVLSRST